MRRSRALPGLLLLAAVTRLAAAALVAPGYQPLLDEEAYHRLALGVLSGEGLSAERGLGPVAVAGQPTSVWGFGQPAWLALLYGVFGVRPAAVFVVNALLGVALVWLSHRLALRVVDARWALAAAAIVALDPWLLRLSASLYGEPLYLTLLVAALLSLTPRQPALSIRRAALGGVLLGLAALIRSTGFYFLPFALLGLGWRLRRDAWRPALAVLVCSLAVVAPWTLRNLRVHGGFVLLDTKAGWNLYNNYHPLRDAPPLRHGHPYLEPPEGYHELSELERNRMLARVGAGFVRERPGLALRRALGHLGDFWSPLPNRETGERLRLLKPLLLLPFELAAALGLLLAWPRRCQLGLLYLLLLHYSFLHSLMIGASRYRAALDPVLACFAALALQWCWRRWRGQPAEAGLVGPDAAARPER